MSVPGIPSPTEKDKGKPLISEATPHGAQTLSGAGGAGAHANDRCGNSEGAFAFVTL